MTFEELIAAFGAKIGVALVADNESCVVGVDDMTVTFLHLDEADKISIYGEIGETPQDGIEELLSAMLGEADPLCRPYQMSARNAVSGRVGCCVLLISRSPHPAKTRSS